MRLFEKLIALIIKLMSMSTLLEDPDGYEVKKEQLSPSQIGLYDLNEKRFVKRVTIDFNVGTLIPLSENFALTLYEHPKLIDLNSGKVVQSLTDMDVGKQESSIIHHLENLPIWAVDRDSKRVAIVSNGGIEILSLVDK